MTGICYITEKPTEYLAEMQIDAIARYTEDDSVALKLEGNFSPAKADHLIEEAIYKDCDNLVFVTENKNVDILSQLIPQEYGQYFENINVIAENYYRLNENDAAAAQPQTQAQAAGALPPNQQKQETEVAGDKIIFVCNAAAPHATLLKKFIDERNALSQRGIPNVATAEQLQKAETWFTNVDSAGLTAANIKKLYESHPSDAIRKAIEMANISNKGYDTNIENLVTMAASSKTVQAGHKYIFIVPKSMAAQSNNANVIISPSFSQSFEHPDNAKILPLISEVAKMIQNPKAEVKKRQDLPKDEEELNKQFSKDEKKLEFIAVYAKAFEWWTKNKDKRLKTEEAASQFEKALKEFLTADFRNAWNYLKNYGDKGIAFLAQSAEKIAKGIKDDLKGKENADDKNKMAKKEETSARNIFSWEKYPELCKLLFND